MRGASVLSHGVGRDSGQDDESEEDEGEAQAGRTVGGFQPVQSAEEELRARHNIYRLSWAI